MDGAKKGAPALLIGFGKAAPEQEGESDTGAMAGSALAKAIKSGDGAAIYSAFEALLQECDSRSEPMDENEPEM